jgi:hypothetical protein
MFVTLPQGSGTSYVSPIVPVFTITHTADVALICNLDLTPIINNPKLLIHAYLKMHFREMINTFAGANELMAGNTIVHDNGDDLPLLMNLPEHLFTLATSQTAGYFELLSITDIASVITDELAILGTTLVLTWNSQSLQNNITFHDLWFELICEFQTS